MTMSEAARARSELALALASPIRDLVGDRDRPLLVALDGRSGTGKSTLARSVVGMIDAVLVEGDDFYAGGAAAEWDRMSTAQRADHCIDWRRQRPVLDALAAGEETAWFAYDWDAFDDSFASAPSRAHPAPVVLLEGVYSARPELADVIDLRVLLELPEAIRQARLLEREGADRDAAWQARWSSAEDHYFTAVMPTDAFDLVIGAP